MAGELTHLGFIVDGNRRWARSRGLPTLEGHRRGFDRVDEVIDVLKDTEVKYASFFIFSTENWDRSQEEIDYLMDMIWKKIDKLTKRLKRKPSHCSHGTPRTCRSKTLATHPPIRGRHQKQYWA